MNHVQVIGRDGDQWSVQWPEVPLVGDTVRLPNGGVRLVRERTWQVIGPVQVFLA
jgi:hypothetical protein